MWQPHLESGAHWPSGSGGEVRSRLARQTGSPRGPSSISEPNKFDGKRVLITNGDTLRIEDAACVYKGFLKIERCFRSLKSVQIHLTSVNHWLPRRIEAHVKICVLALLIQRAAEVASKQPWSSLRRNLADVKVIQLKTETHRLFQCNGVSQGITAILEALGIPLPKQVLDVRKKASNLQQFPQRFVTNFASAFRI